VIVTSLQELNRSRIRRIQRIGYAVSPGNHLAAQTPGGEVNPKLKHLMKELGEAINDSLSESEEIAEVISKIKAGGYDVFLVLEATIGFNKQEQEEEEATESAGRHSGRADFKVTSQDMKFLKSLRITLDDAA
jgi:hypothetical protein